MCVLEVGCLVLILRTWCSEELSYCFDSVIWSWTHVDRVWDKWYNGWPCTNHSSGRNI